MQFKLLVTALLASTALGFDLEKRQMGNPQAAQYASEAEALISSVLGPILPGKK